MPPPCKACQNSSEASRFLKSQGIRITELRRNVLKFLHHSKQPVGAYDLFDQLKSNGKASAPPAVYRVLDFLVDQGLAHKLRSISAYTACCNGPKSHKAAFLICRLCGDVQELVQPNAPPLHSQAKQQDFQVENVTLELTGLCGACQ